VAIVDNLLAMCASMVANHAVIQYHKYHQYQNQSATSFLLTYLNSLTSAACDRPSSP